MPDEIAERPHHPRSPSKLQNLEACPCFEAQGTVVHKRTTAGTLGHKVIDSQEDDLRLGDEDALATARCLDFVAGRRELLQHQADEASRRLQPKAAFQITELKEVYLPIDACQYEDAGCTTGGYADHGLLSFDGTYAELIDWKLGLWPVEAAENNTQAIAYTLGLFRMYPKLTKVRFFFFQPLLDYVTEAEFDRAQIPVLYLRIKTIVDRAVEAKRLADFSMAAPHSPVCMFCSQIGKCPKVFDFALGVAKKFHPLAFPDSVTPSQVHNAKNTRLAMELAGVLKVWTDAFKRQITGRILRGDAELPAGYKLQDMPGRRGIKDLEKFRIVALKYLTEQEYQACLEASFGSLEDKISEKAPRGHKTATIELFQHELEESGAVERGDGYCFLKAVPVKE